MERRDPKGKGTDRKDNSPKTCYLIGHAHIDAAWLWTREETIKVCHDTFSAVLDLMDRYQNFYFSQSSAQYYAWMEERYPGLFARIRERVREGRWEIVGGMWVEPDCNLLSGESLVRQVLHGKRYFQEKFGVDVKVAWLPDTFGFPASLPQILKRAGIDYFLTAKLNYRTTLPFPYNVFRWCSPDGSCVLGCHPVGEYNEGAESLVPEVLLRQFLTLWRAHRLDELILIYGKGDHGGGPTVEMLERATQLAREDHFRIIFSSARAYFQRLAELQAQGKEFPTISDELYLKVHRGTYTTQAWIKRANRRAECLLESAEKFSAIAELLGLGEYYHREQLRSAWRKLLFNQFHDILAGSSIPQVYKEAEKDFREICNSAAAVLNDALGAIAANVDTAGEGLAIVVFNPLSWERAGVIELELPELTRRLGSSSFRVRDTAGQELPLQVTDEGQLIFVAPQVPPLGYRTFQLIPAEDVLERKVREHGAQVKLGAQESGNELILKNGRYRLIIDKTTGQLTSIYDKVSAREVLRGRGNVLQVYEDGPSIEDAWNINLGALTELDQALEAEIVERGPVRVKARVQHVYRQAGRPDSRFIQEIALYRDLPWIEFAVKADWHAAHRLVKVAFPLAVHSEWTTYEIPYGTLRRRDPSAPRATAAERAKWEVAAQKWLDHAAESGEYGVSLLNEAKNGFDVQHDVIRMTLLRSPAHPDPLEDPPEFPPLTDQGEHLIRYALYPHRGDWRAGGTVQRGYEFNYPLVAVLEPAHPGRLPRAMSVLKVDPETVILQVLKRPEDADEGGLILRLYEGSGRSTSVRLEFTGGLQVKGVWETDLLERDLRGLQLSGTRDALQIALAPHEVRTLKLVLKIE